MSRSTESRVPSEPTKLAGTSWYLIALVVGQGPLGGFRQLPALSPGHGPQETVDRYGRDQRRASRGRASSRDVLGL